MRNVTLNVNEIPFGVASVGDTLRLTVLQGSGNKVRKVNANVVSADAFNNTITLAVDEGDAQRVNREIDVHSAFTVNVKRRNGSKLTTKASVLVASVNY